MLQSKYQIKIGDAIPVLISDGLLFRSFSVAQLLLCVLQLIQAVQQVARGKRLLPERNCCKGLQDVSESGRRRGRLQCVSHR